MSIAQYLAELVKAQLDGRKPLDLPEGISVEEILDIARRNHMDYLLLGALIKVESLSEEHKQSMRSKVMGSLMRTMTQVTEIKELEKCFEEAGVKNQPMKGARMKFIYPAPEMREMSDIDVLIDGPFIEAKKDLSLRLRGSANQHIRQKINNAWELVE